LVCSIGCASSRASTEATEGGPLVIHNARVHGHGGATAVRIVGGRIVGVGDETLVDGADELIDAGGGLVLPGFHDAHIHLVGGGLSLSRVQIAEAKTLQATLQIIGDWAKANPDVPWVRGRGWSYDIVPKGSFPTAAMLDAVVPDRPAILSAYDGHSAWLNSKALALAKIDRGTKAPDGGMIVTDASGDPTGALLENAESLVDAVLPEPTRAEKKAALVAAIAHVVGLGVTSVDAIEADPEALAIFHELEREGALPIQVAVFLPIEGDHDAYVALQADNTERVKLVGVKGFVDGVVESKTAAMVTPYEGSSARGEPMLPKATLFPLVGSAHRHGLQVVLHSVGDGAVRLSLDAFEAAQKAHPELPKIRHRVEHVEIIDAAELPRFAAIGAVASMQPYHAVPYEPDPDAGAWSENLGATRRKMTFAWRMLEQAGAAIAFGSDWPVYTAAPLAGLGVALSRKNERGFPPDGWNAHQVLSIDSAIRAYAIERGEPLGPSTTVGAIALGQRADLVVLAPGASLEHPLTLFTAKIRAVIAGGKRAR
jgi:predicted amidohydrolase YtcJ